ncbi:MAG: M23 family metallopeptidase [Mycetocola sp.]
MPYALGQRGRLREGVAAIAGNYVILALPEHSVFVALVHLRRGSLRVGTGDRVAAGFHLADCGNSGNSTQPHLHLQAMDSEDLTVARGIPISFRRFCEQPPGKDTVLLREAGVPAEGSAVEPADP